MRIGRWKTGVGRKYSAHQRMSDIINHALSEYLAKLARERGPLDMLAEIARERRELERKGAVPHETT